MKGVRRVVQLPDAVAVVADSWWQREESARRRCPIDWDDGGNGDVSSDTIASICMRAWARRRCTRRSQRRRRRRRPCQSGQRGSKRTMRCRSSRMRPWSRRTARRTSTADRVEIWVPTQDGETALATAATPPACRADKVMVHKTMLGGGFGRRGDRPGFRARRRSLIAKEVDEPVKLLWTREEDTRHDFYRPVAMARMIAGLDADGMPIAWKIRIVRPVHHRGGLSPRHAVRGRSQLSPGPAGRHALPRAELSRRTTRCATRMCRSASGAASTTRRTRSSRKVSSTRWRTPREPTLICSARTLLAQKPKRARGARRRRHARRVGLILAAGRVSRHRAPRFAKQHLRAGGRGFGRRGWRGARASRGLGDRLPVMWSIR